VTVRGVHVTRHAATPERVDVPEPVAAAGMALVATTAAPITPLDVLCASGTSYFGAPALPYVPGVQGVGVVVSSDAYARGTRVWFPTSAGMAPGDGSLAERVLVADAELVPLSADVPDSTVAAFGLSAVAAWMSLTWRGRLGPGERVLVLGAGGVVGQVAVQAARLLGAGAVYAACRSDRAAETASAAGADAVVRLRPDDEPHDLAARIRDACAGPVDLVIDPLCGVPGTAAALCLAPEGRLVNLGSSAGSDASYSSASLRGGGHGILGYTNNALTPDQRRGALDLLLTHAAAGDLSVEHDVVTLDALPAAWQAQADGTNERRAVVTFG
jgi:NADPH:quinone reductase-like Zn-dependent oxidoreductase